MRMKFEKVDKAILLDGARFAKFKTGYIHVRSETTCLEANVGNGAGIDTLKSTAERLKAAADLILEACNQDDSR